MNYRSQILFWSITTLLLVLGFSLTFGDVIISIFWVSLFLPASLVTSYVFNQVLIPKYLLIGRYPRFWIYLIYTLVISLYVQMLIALFTFVVLADLEISNMSPVMTNLFVLGAVMYLIVLVQTSMLMFESFQKQKQLIAQFTENEKRQDNSVLVVKVKRKNVFIPHRDIMHIESQSDYVNIHLGNEKLFTVKATITGLMEELPEEFLRVHRSYIVNTEKITAFTSSKIQINSNIIPVGRSYKNQITQLSKY